jgi:hypothetical protein
LRRYKATAASTIASRQQTPTTLATIGIQSNVSCFVVDDEDGTVLAGNKLLPLSRLSFVVIVVGDVRLRPLDVIVRISTGVVFSFVSWDDSVEREDAVETTLILLVIVFVDSDVVLITFDIVIATTIKQDRKIVSALLQTILPDTVVMGTCDDDKVVKDG